MKRTVLASTALVLALAAPASAAPAADPTPAPQDHKKSGDKEGQATDPVCGMEVDKKTAPSAIYKRKTYYFCSPEDQAKFQKTPGAYVGKK